MIRAALVAFILLAGAAHAQSTDYAPPRNASGQPDLSGVWAAEFITPLERPRFHPALVVAPDAAVKFSDQLLAGAPPVIDPDISGHAIRKLANVRGELRSSIIVDPPTGAIPYSPAGLKVAGQSFQQFNFAYDNPEDRSLQERCIGGFVAPPMRVLPSIIPMRIEQTPGHIILNLEDTSGLRIVHLSSTPPPGAIRTVEGWSSGRWEGATLVIETSHFRADLPVREQYGRPVVIGPDTKITERFTRLSTDDLLYEFTVTDPHFYTQPWRGEFTLQRLAARDYEYACHEANYSMRNVLLGGRAEAARKAAR